MKKLLGFAAIVLLAAPRADAQYNPVGPQLNVDISTVTSGGWTQCFVQGMGQSLSPDASNVLNACSGSHLMMAGRAAGSNLLLVLAEGLTSDVTQFTPIGDEHGSNLVNGAQWYFTPDWSWGFAGAGEAVNRNSCDYGDSGADRMCVHLPGGGYRIGDIITFDDDYEKVFFDASDADLQTTPEPASLVLIATGLAGIVAIRRRKA